MGQLTFPLAKVENPYNANWGNVARLYPSNDASKMSWKHKGDVTIQGKKWSGDTTITASGDPTSNTAASLGINTGANHDANVEWLCVGTDATERQVRGVRFRTYTNGAKFRPRISGVALRYLTTSGALYYHGLHYRSDGYEHSTGGSLNYEGTDHNHYYWGVGKTNSTDGAHFHDKNKVLTGVLFHMETTWKSGSAVWCYCYIYGLRFIFDGGSGSNPNYSNKMRMWGVSVK